MEKYRHRIEEIGRQITADMHLAIYDVEEKLTAKGRVIVVFLTKIGGVTLDDCAVFSRKLGEELEIQDFIPEQYFLEVSSPGIERPLKLKMHYASAISELVEIIWNEGDKRVTTTGILTEVNPDSIVVEEAKKGRIEIPISAVHKARTCFLNKRSREQK